MSKLKDLKENNVMNFFALLFILLLNFISLHFLLYTYGKIDPNKINSVVTTFTFFSLISIILIIMCIFFGWLQDNHPIIGVIVGVFLLLVFIAIFFVITKVLSSKIKLLHDMDLTPVSLIFTIVTFTLTSVFFDGESWANTMKSYKLSKTGQLTKFFVQLYLITLSTTFTIWHYINYIQDDYAVAFFVTFALIFGFLVSSMLFFYIIYHWSNYNGFLYSILSKLWDYDSEYSYLETSNDLSLDDSLFNMSIKKARKR